MSQFLLFAPYGAWKVHHQLDATLGQALIQKGHQVNAVVCDQLFDPCIVASYPKNPKLCAQCHNSGCNLFNQFQLPFVSLSTYIQEQDQVEIQEQLNDITDIESAMIDGNPIYQWVHAGVCSQHIHMGDVAPEDLKNLKLRYMFNGALLARILNRIFNQGNYRGVVSYNSKHPFYRVCFEIAKSKKIRTLVHERGRLDGSFELRENNYGHFSSGRVEAFENWKNIPLSTEQLNSIRDYFKDRELGKNLNRAAFYAPDIQGGELYKKLRIPSGFKIISLFTSSDWELARDKFDVARPFKDSCQGLLKAIREIRLQKDEILVIRVHPNVVQKKQMDHQFLKNLFELQLSLPENCRLLMPTEPIKSYELAWLSSACLSFGSTLGVETISRGLVTQSSVNNIYSVLDMCEFGGAHANFGDLIEKSKQQTANISIDDLRLSYRRAYFFFNRLSIYFNSFGIINHGTPDIKIKSFDELKPGQDVYLDKMVNFLEDGSTLHPQPPHFTSSELDKLLITETQLLQEELESIKSKRALMFQSQDWKESPMNISLIRLRCDGKDQIHYEKDGRFLRSALKSRVKPLSLEESSWSFLSSLDENLRQLLIAIDTSEGDYIHISPDEVQVDESLYSQTLDLIHPTINNVFTGAYVMTEDDRVSDQVLTAHKPVEEWNQLINQFRIFEDPRFILALGIWKKEHIRNFIYNHINDQDSHQFAKSVFELLTQEVRSNTSKSLNQPLVSIFTPRNQAQERQIIKALFDKGYSEEFEIASDKYTGQGFADSKIHMMRIHNLMNQNRYREALSIAEQWQYDHPGSPIEPSEFSTLRDKGLAQNQYSQIKKSVDKVDGHLVPGQEKFLFDQVMQIPEDGKILEIGSNYGKSTTAMSLACAGTQRSITCIDTFMGMKAGGTRNEGASFVDIFSKNVYLAGGFHRITSIPGYSHENLLKFEQTPQFDLAFIDASHHYEDVLKDFLMVYPLMKEGAVVLFHDVEPGWPGPWRCWRQCASLYLTDHVFCSSISGGRISRSTPIAPTEEFDFVNDWIQFYRESRPDLANVMDAARNTQDESNRQHIETQFLQCGDHFLNQIKAASRKELLNDPWVYHWNHLLYKLEGNEELAQQNKDICLKVLESISDQKLLEYYQVPAKQPKTTNTHYDAKYFNWQKSIGEFGGMANKFKFQDYLSSNKVTLDFGCGGGYLLDNIEASQKLGCEINPEARKVAENKGYQVFENSTQLPSDFFDLIISNHALEHCHHPFDVLMDLKNSLKPGGEICLVVPHDNCTIEYNPDDVNQHLYTWNAMTLGNLFKSVGFEILIAESIQHQWVSNYTEVWQRHGEEEFHRQCHHQAKANNNFQIRVVAKK